MKIKVGDTVGRWKILSHVYEHNRWMVNVVCDCGNSSLVRESSIVCGDSLSCGCLARENTSKRVTTHGLSKHPLFSVWYDAYRRCNHPQRKDYQHYGGRGINLCKEWLPPAENGFLKFLEDMGDSFEEGLELDRRDVDDNYSKENCRWVTRAINCSNKRSYFIDNYVNYNGDYICLTELSRNTGIPNRVLWDRLFKLGWSYEKATQTPMRFKRFLVEWQGERYNLRSFCRTHRINYEYFKNTKKTSGFEAAFNKFLLPNGVVGIYGETKGEQIFLLGVEIQ